MKLIFKALALTALVSLSACKKEDDDKNPSGSGDLKTEIVGSWEVTALEQKNGESKVNGQVMNTFSSEGYDFIGDIEFMGDGSVATNIGYTVDMVVTTNIPGMPPQTQNITETIPQTSGSGTYEVVNNSQIKMSGFDGTSVVYNYEVVSFSNNILELKSDMSLTQTEQGVTVESSFDHYMTLKKM